MSRVNPSGKCYYCHASIGFDTEVCNRCFNKYQEKLRKTIERVTKK